MLIIVIAFFIAAIVGGWPGAIIVILTLGVFAVNAAADVFGRTSRKKRQ